ncbi:fructosamine kinase family protein [Inquilinus sp. CAU 1745]|uniref:fructosamine kinase family protein n=1 Tax=Inquilinus sp. CAU 1745 TaxID=3140369 RepID=UPI00325BBE6F
MTDLAERVEATLGRRPVRLVPLQGGSTVQVMRADFAGGDSVLVKHGAGHLAIERAMLDDLARLSDLPLPAVLHGEDDLLLLEFLPHEPGPPGAEAQRHAADLMAAFHAVPRNRFGYPYDTVIGQLPQPNPQSDEWVPFFRDHRLLHMTIEGHREGTVTTALRHRLEALAARIDHYIDEPPHPSLLHGDLWTGNVLHRGGRIVGLIDPAIHHGHPEMDLAYPTLFGTFDAAFYDRYRELAPLAPDFFELRRDLYNIYPLLVHVRYWDASYARPIEATLSRLGV